MKTTRSNIALFIAISATLALTACGGNDAEPAASVTTAPATTSTAPGDTTTPDDNALANAGNEATEWLTYGRDYAETRFSPLTQINSNNVSDLGLA